MSASWGGSLAEELLVEAIASLERELRASPQFAGKQVVIVRLALSGYKQPQQLMLVNYLLTLGGEFDILMNIDGYNDVALPALENVPNGVFAAYPRGWQLRVTQAGDVVTLRLVGRIGYLQSLSQRCGGIFSSRPARFSPTWNLLGMACHAALHEALNQDFNDLGALTMTADNPAASGPR